MCWENLRSSERKRKLNVRTKQRKGGRTMRRLYQRIQIIHGAGPRDFVWIHIKRKWMLTQRKWCFLSNNFLKTFFSEEFQLVHERHMFMLL